MLTIIVEEAEDWDEENEKFLRTPGFVLQLEHSLTSLSKWESKYHKPFLVPGEKTNEEIYGYIEAMQEGEIVPIEKFSILSEQNMRDIKEYIDSPQSATTFYDPESKNPSRRSETITSELIYFWMASYNIPFGECEHWHLNRLLNLLKICSIKNSKQKPMSNREIAERNRELNAQRRAKTGSRG